MKDLRVLFADLGFQNVETYLQSGNVVFGPSGSSGDPASRVSSAIKETFGHEVEVLVFSGPAFNEIASANPILERSGRDESFLHVTFLFNSDLSPIPDEELPTNEGEEVLFRNGHYFLYCPSGYGRTKISNSYFEKKLKTSATTRNWKTVSTLREWSKAED
jgi:uncharacterized protein (DUF1697 family)